MTDRTHAVDAFIEIRFNAVNMFERMVVEILGNLDRLRELVDDHLGKAPNDITWTDVGTMSHIGVGIRELLVLVGLDEEDSDD